MQITMWGIPPAQEASYFVYHDESGDDALHDRFLFQGALFVPEAKAENALTELAKARDGYRGRIHFSELRDRTSSKRGAAARNWLNVYFGCLAEFCRYKCMIADRTSQHLKVTRHAIAHELYNYTAKLAIRGGITWFFKDLDRLLLTIFSEKMDRSPVNNFVIYLPREIASKSIHATVGPRRGPEVVMCLPEVQLIESDPDVVAPVNAGHCEFIQLTDLLTGAVSEAVNVSAKQTIKLDLGKLAAQWIVDARRPPWVQSLGLHRHFSVSCFPGSDGGFYDVALGIEDKDQLNFLDYHD